MQPSSPGHVLHHALVVAPGAPAPERWMLILHGILGSGSNWRTFARALAAARPSWGFLLPDLRLHGQSQGAPPPHTLDAAALDLERTAEAAGVTVTAAMGHSFGGKVALAFAARRRDRGAPLDELFVLDSAPGARAGDPRRDGASEVLRMLRAIPQPLDTREAFLAHVEGQGHSRALAEWLAMNLRRAPDGLRLRLELPAVGELLDDYFRVDLWPVLESDPGAARRVHVVLGGRSDAVPPEEKARFEALASKGRASLTVLERAGHWLHADDPAGLLAAIESELPPDSAARAPNAPGAQ